MRLRKLLPKDAPLMLEWMHDKNVVAYMHVDFASRTLVDCQEFIENSQNEFPDYHLAIVDDSDEYLGTVSLKHIDLHSKTAEFAICVRSCAMGKGVARKAMAEIIEKGFKELKLNRIYWCVIEQNLRARNFYYKNGYSQCVINDVHGGGDIHMVWYMVERQ